MTGILLLGLALAGCGDSNALLGPGSQAPDISVGASAEPSHVVNLKDLRGKVVLIDFWATWCIPCKLAMPHIEQLYKANKDKGLEVMAITADDSPKVLDFLTHMDISFPTYVDDGSKASTAFNVLNLPTTYVIGKDGKIAYSTIGSSPTVEKDIDEAVEKALK